jgi:hypothetical protein
LTVFSFSKIRLEALPDRVEDGSHGGAVRWMFVSYRVRFVRTLEQMFGSSKSRFHSLRFRDARA